MHQYQPYNRGKRRINWLGLILLNLFVAQFTFILLNRVRNNPAYSPRVISKRYVNPWMLKFAGRFNTPQGIITHVGRKSGRTYATPIAATPIPNGFIIALPYGTDVDWCRNILASGNCTIQWHDATYKLFEPEIVAIDAIIAQFSSFWQVAMRITGHKQALKLKLSTDHVDYISTVSA